DPRSLASRAAPVEPPGPPTSGSTLPCRSPGKRYDEALGSREQESFSSVIMLAGGGACPHADAPRSRAFRERTTRERQTVGTMSVRLRGDEQRGATPAVAAAAESRGATRDRSRRREDHVHPVVQRPVRGGGEDARRSV